MRTIYLIRHGKPDFPNGEKMCLGTTELSLDAEGIAQAQAMALSLPPVTAVFSSPLLRAVQTAQAIGKPVTVLSGLREYHMGAWDGLTFRKIREQYPELYAARGEHADLPVPGAEDRAAGRTRFASAMEEAICQSTGDIAVVAHGGVIAAFLESIGGKPAKPGYAQVVALSYDGAFVQET